MRSAKKVRFLTGGAVAFLAVLCAVSVCIGSYPISLSDIAAIAAGGEVSAMARRVFFALRLPRVGMGLMAGAGLGLCGAVFQMLFQNPLASPDLVGVANGAGAGAAFAIVWGAGSVRAVTGGAFLGGMLALAGVFLLVWLSGGNRPGIFIVSGILLSSLANACIMLLKHAADSEGKLAAIDFWTMGSLAGITAEKVRGTALVCVPAMLLLILLHREILVMGLGDEQAHILGLSAGKMRMLLLALATLCVAGVIAVTGVISFVGLLAPHGAFLLLGRKNRSYLWMSGVVGAGLTVAADCFARSVTAGELPLSILTTLCALPFFLFFIGSGRGEGL